MKSTFVLTLTLLLASFMLPGCDKAADAKAAGEKAASAVGDMDLDSMKTMATDLTSKLGSITDLASAKDIGAKALPMLAKLGAAKEMLKGKLDLSSLGGVVTTLKEKFAGKADIMKVLQPVLDKIMALVK